VSRIETAAPSGKLDYAGAAAALSLSVRTLKSLVKARRIAHFRLGRRVLFGAHHIQEFLEFNEQRVIQRKRVGS